MMKEREVIYSTDELKEMKGKTDFDRLRRTSEKDIERQVENDPDLVIPTDEELKEFRPVHGREKK